VDLLERWDRHNRDWAASSMRDPHSIRGVRIIAGLGIVYAVITAVGVAMQEWLVVAVAGFKAQVFLTVALYFTRWARRTRGAGAAAVAGPAGRQPRRRS
jgi:hypothetical protein